MCFPAFCMSWISEKKPCWEEQHWWTQAYDTIRLLNHLHQQDLDVHLAAEPAFFSQWSIRFLQRNVECRSNLTSAAGMFRVWSSFHSIKHDGLSQSPYFRHISAALLLQWMICHPHLCVHIWFASLVWDRLTGLRKRSWSALVNSVKWVWKIVVHQQRILHTVCTFRHKALFSGCLHYTNIHYKQQATMHTMLRFYTKCSKWDEGVTPKPSYKIILYF